MSLPGRWWLNRSLRTRLVLSAAGPLVLALVIGTVAVAAVFSAGRIRDLDAQTRAEAEQVSALVEGGQVPVTLPVPAGSPLLVQVLDAEGTVVAAGPAASRVLPLVDRAGAQVGTDEAGSYAGVPLRLRVEKVGSLRVVVAAPLGDVRRALHALGIVLLLVVPLLVLATVLTVYWVTGLALRPVENLRRAAEELSRNPTADDALPVPPGADELSRLAQTLNQLLSSVHRLVAQQERFVADAAHELRSPLTALRVQLEVAQAHPRGVVVTELLDDLHAEALRLAGLVDDLLALARWEGGAALQRRRVDLRELASAQGPPAMVLGDEQALSRLVHNLTSNAHRYGATVRVTTSIDGGEAVLAVDDDGPGIPVADRERVFDRWVRLDEARDRGQGGSGLGLALVREIAKLHGGDVSVTDSALGGARFELRLPLAG